MDAIVANRITGNGSVAKTGANAITLSAINDYTGGTTVSAGTLSLAGAGTLGNIANSTTVNGGILDLGATTQTQAALNQSGGTVQNGRINVGSYQLTAGALAAGTTVSATTTFDIRAGTIDGVLAGAGALTKTTAGTVFLTGSNTYTGATAVNGGILSVSGSIANSAVTVNAGGTLGGNGIVGNTMVNGGTLSPGNSIGLLTVQGNLSFTAAASYMVEISPANADRTNVTGTATLGGATVNASFAPGSYVTKQYTIVNATGGVVGTFGSLVNTNLPANFSSSLSYDANNAFLNLQLTFTPAAGSNSNQLNLTTALTSFFNTTGGIPLVFGTLSPAGLTQISGETATGSQQTTFNAMTQFMGTLLDPFIDGRGGTSSPPANTPAYANEEALAYADGKKRSRSERDAFGLMTKAPLRNFYDPRWSVWAAAYGGSQTTDGNSALGSNNSSSRLFGTAVGFDYRFSPSTIAGFALAGGGTNFSVANGGSGRSDLFQAGAFVKHTVGKAYIAGALAYGWQDVTTDRTVTVAGVDHLRAQFNANAYSGRIEGGYRFVAPWMGGFGVTPYAAGQFTTFDLPAYAEQVVSGANTFTLAYGSRSVTATRSELGLRADKSYAMQTAVLTLRGRAAWAHDFNADRAVGATFQTLPGASFVVNGARQAGDSALATASAEVKWMNGFAVAATFEGEFSDVTKSYAGKGVARYSW